VVGGTAALTSLSTDAAGSTMLAGNVSTAGAQIYNDALTLGGDALLASSGGGAITLGSTVNGAHNLAVNTAGMTVFGGAAGGTTALTSLSTDAAGSTTLNGNVSTTGAQVYNDAVLLGSNVTLASTNSGVSFGNTVNNATATKRNLTVDAGNGALTFTAPAGGGANGALAGLTTHSGTFSASALAIGSGGLSVTSAADGISQSGAFTVAGASSFGTGANAITLGNASNHFTGAVSLAGGNVSLLNNSATQLGASTVAGTLDVGSNGTLTQTGALTVTGPATFTQNSTTSGTSQDILLDAQNNDFKSDVTFAAGAAINNLSLKNTDPTPGMLTLPANVAGNLTLNYTNAALKLPVTGVGGALSASAAGGIVISDNVISGGGQTYANAVTLDADAVLSSTSNAVSLVSTVDGARNLTVNGSGLITFGGAVGGTTALTSLTVNGSTLLDGSVSTTGAQTYDSAVTLGSDVTLTSTGDGAIDLNSTIDGAHSLTVHTGGMLIFRDAVGGVTPLGGLTMTSGTLAIDVHNIPMEISGNAHIGGTLEVNLGSAPSPGQTFTVLTAGSITGTYATVNALGLAAGTVATATYSATSVTLTIAQAAPDLTVSMTHDPAYVPYGGLVTYTISVHNLGNIDVANAQISNTLPAGLTAATPSWTCTAAGGASCTASGSGALADSLSIPANPADSVTYLLNAWVDPSTDSESIQNTVTVTKSGDVNPANNTANDTLQIVLFRDGFDPPQ
jgi:uncharacterized repeat protein (TIGR01451 family)